MKPSKGLLTSLLSVTGLVAGMLALATPAYAGTFTVTTTADSGTGSLRQAILDANANPGADVIGFALPGTGVHTISPASNLPLITDAVTIDGTTQGSSGAPVVELDGTNAGVTGTGLALEANGTTVRGLTINRFAYQQLLIDSANNTVASNFLGTDAAGTTGLAVGGFGTLRFRNGGSGNVIGGTAPSARNVIYGPVAIESGANNNSIQGNAIGVAADGSVLGGGGVRVTGATGNAIIGNAIAATSGLAIDLGGDGVTANDAGDADGGANNQQNFPVINTVAVSGGSATVSGILQSEAGKNYRVDFFRNRSVGCNSSGHGGGEAFLDSINVTTDLNGNATISGSNLGGVNAVLSGDVITATATDPSGNTSEFSSCVTATAPTAPGPPTGVHAGAGDASATVSWSAPASDGGSPVTSYGVYRTGGALMTTVSAPSTSAQLTGLTNGMSYTFFVKAQNANGDSVASANSDTVTPTAGEPPATSKSQTVAAGGTVSTGAAPTGANPTVTAVSVPGGGTVSIAESSTSDTPPGGGTFVGQQVDITAPDATPGNPLVLTFKYDASTVDASKPLKTYRTEGNGPETLVADCVGSPDALADGTPCVTGRTKNATTGDWTVKVNTASASRWRTSQPEGCGVGVSVGSTDYSPQSVTAIEGSCVQWTSIDTGTHAVTEKANVGPGSTPLFDSGALGNGATYSYNFAAAGTYSYHSLSSDPTTMTGTVKVPLKSSATSGGTATSITLTWSSATLPGYRFDVQYRFKAAGTASYGAWTTWMSNTTAVSAAFTANALKGAGTYQFRSHLENSGTLKASGYCPAKTITIR